MLRVTYERMKRGWSKATLARKARLDQSLLSKIESGRIKPYKPEQLRIAKALSIPLSKADKLFDEVPDYGNKK